jgi:hypothetical protein
LYKAAAKKKTAQIQSKRTTDLKSLFLNEDTKNSMGSVTTNLINLFGLALGLFSSAYLSKIPVAEVHHHKAEILILYLVTI